MGKKQMCKQAMALSLAAAMAAGSATTAFADNGNRMRPDTGGMKTATTRRMNGNGLTVMGMAFPRVIISVQTVIC